MVEGHGPLVSKKDHLLADVGAFRSGFCRAKGVLGYLVYWKQSCSPGLGYRLAPVIDVQFAVQVSGMAFDGMKGDGKLVGNLLIAHLA